MEAGLVLFFFLTLSFLSTITKSIRFDVESGVTKCIAEDLRIKSMTVGEYSVVNPNEGQPLPEHHRIYVGVYAENQRQFHDARDVESGQFGFEVVEDGKHFACFATIKHEPAVNTSVDLNWRSGVAAKSWSRLIKKGSVDAMEIELKKMEDTINWIHEEMLYLRERLVTKNESEHYFQKKISSESEDKRATSYTANLEDKTKSFKNCIHRSWDHHTVMQGPLDSTK